MKTRADALSATSFSLSLSAGFFGFFAHIGFVEALESKGLKPKEVSGSSAGALVAAGIASGHSAQELKDIFLSIQKKDFWDPSFGLGYLKGQKFEELLNLYCVKNFAETQIPLHISVFNIKRRRTEVITEGLVVQACRASAAVPVFFHPVQLNKNYFWDGGIGDRPGHKGVESSQLTSVIHYLNAGDFISRLEDQYRYKYLHQKPFFFKTLSPYKMGPSSLEKGQKVIEHFFKITQKWLEEKI